MPSSPCPHHAGFSCVHILQFKGNSYTLRCPPLLPVVPQGGCQGARSCRGMGAWAFCRATQPAAHGAPDTGPGQRLAAHGCPHSQEGLWHRHPLLEGALGFLGMGGSLPCAPRWGDVGERDSTVLGAHRAPPTQKAGGRYCPPGGILKHPCVLQGHELAPMNAMSINHRKIHVGDGRGVEGEEALCKGWEGELRERVWWFLPPGRGGTGDSPREAGCRAWGHSGRLGGSFCPQN